MFPRDAVLADSFSSNSHTLMGGRTRNFDVAKRTFDTHTDEAFEVLALLTPRTGFADFCEPGFCSVWVSGWFV